MLEASSEEPGYELLRTIRLHLYNWYSENQGIRKPTYEDILAATKLNYNHYEKKDPVKITRKKLRELMDYYAELSSIFPVEEQVSYRDRIKVFEAWNYPPDSPLPNAADDHYVINAVKASELDNRKVPAYLLDCRTRILCLSDMIPKLFPATLFHSIVEANIPLLHAYFSQKEYPFRHLIANDDLFLYTLLKRLKSLLNHYILNKETWPARFISETKELFPEFAQLWDRVEQEESPATTSVPYHLELKSGAVYRLNRVRISHEIDQRYYINEFLPQNMFARKQVEGWLEERNDS